MRPGREERLVSLIGRLAAEFLEREITEELILTVNRVELDAIGARAKIYVTVFPDAAEPVGISQARRLRRPLQQFLQTHLKSKRTPYIDVVIDDEEKRKRNYGLVAKR